MARPIPEDWWPLAECLGLNPDLFFPNSEEIVPPEAANTCARCRVRPQCAEYALSDPDLRGVWAGMTSNERRKLRRRQPDSDGIVWETG